MTGVQTCALPISLENDEEFSVGIHAFYEAIQRYTAAKGSFLPFAQLVIRSRVINSVKAQKKDKDTISLDNEKYQKITDELESKYKNPEMEMENVIADEIKKLDSILKGFSFSLKDLASLGPKHAETRERAITIGQTVQKDEGLTQEMYKKNGCL